jgi:hypothetical protein
MMRRWTLGLVLLAAVFGIGASGLPGPALVYAVDWFLADSTIQPDSWLGEVVAHERRRMGIQG